MPYKVDSGPQSDSGNPAVKDVYHSSDVYVNHVPVALWAEGSASGTSAASIKSGVYYENS